MFVFWGVLFGGRGAFLCICGFVGVSCWYCLKTYFVFAVVHLFDCFFSSVVIVILLLLFL